MPKERARHDIHVSSAILSAPHLSHGEKMVYIAIRSRQGNGPGCFAEQSTLASDIDSSRSFVNRAIGKLVWLGWVSKEDRILRCNDEPGPLTITCAKCDQKAHDCDCKACTESDHSAQGCAQKAQQSAQKAQGCAQKAQPSESQPLKPTSKANNESPPDGGEAGASQSAGAGGDPPGEDPSQNDTGGDGKPYTDHTAVKIYQGFMHFFPNEVQRELIAEHIDEESTPHLNAWKAELGQTLKHGWRKSNIPNILTRTSERLEADGNDPLDLPAEILEEQGRNGNGRRESRGGGRRSNGAVRSGEGGARKGSRHEQLVERAA